MERSFSKTNREQEIAEKRRHSISGISNDMLRVHMSLVHEIYSLHKQKYNWGER